ncbi:ABC transporter permease [Arhodomonas aquaeolei]|uniref:ABC transporter permease n=1 Tax=Arhodomonas aquaeolei TaxID=2369 RepID=UPI00037373BD|nr:ABC transporter permease [Arhodomonas aquaeolei]
MRWLLLAGRRALLREPLQLLIAVAGIALGVAVVVAVDVANRAARDALDDAVTRVAGAATHQVVPAGDDLPESVYRRLRVRVGVARAMPVVSGDVTVAGRRYRLLGIDPLVAGPFRTGVGAEADAPLAPMLVHGDRIAVTTATARALGVARGDVLWLDAAGGRHRVRVERVLATVGGRLDGVILTDIAAAQELLDRVGRLSRIDLIADAATAARVRGALPPGVRLFPAGQRRAGLAGMTRAFHVNLRAMSLLALAVGLFLVLNTMSFLVVRRRGMLATLRAVGATRGQVVVQVLADAARLAAAGTLLGLPLGAGLGVGLSGLVATTVDRLYLSIPTVNPWQPTALVAGALLGLAGPLAAALPAALEAAGVTPRAGLARAHLETRAWRSAGRMAAVGVLAGSAGAVVILRTSGLIGGFAGLFAVILGSALLAPAWVRLAARVGGAAGPLGWRLAVRGASASLSRTGVAVAALSVAVATVIGVATMIGSFRASVVDWLDASLRSELYIDADAGVPAGLAERVAAMPGVARVTRGARRRLAVADGELTVRGVSITAADRRAYPMVRGGPEAWRAFSEDRAVLLSEPLAARQGLGPGDALTLPTPDGPETVKVAGVYRDYANVRGTVLMRLGLFRRFWGAALLDGIGVVAAPGTDVDALAARVRARLPAGATLVDNATVRRRSLAVFDQTFRVTRVLQLLAAVVAFVGVLGALMALQLERVREFAVLRALGLTRRGLAGQVLAQSGFLGVAAGVWAVPLGLVLAWLLVAVINRRAFGWGLALELQPAALAQGVALAVAAAVLAAAWPAWRLARQIPAAGLRGD